jgi:uncharacterized membrane protein YidH (DUF202 family)
VSDGLQAERTRLAWRRSVLAASITVLLLGREALVRADLVAFLLIAAGSALWLGLALAAQRRIHAMADPEPGPPSPPAVLLCTVLVVALAAVAAVTVLRH